MALDESTPLARASRAVAAPSSGQVWLRTRKDRHGGRVVGADGERVSIALAPPARARFRRWSGVALEWVQPAGLAHARVRVDDVRVEGAQTLVDVRLIESPTVVERREQLRAAIALEAEAWTLLDATTRAIGATIDVSARGALVRLPELHPAAESVELRLHLPSGPLATHARVARREDDIVGFAFDELTPEDEQRLVDLVFACLA